MSSLNKVTLIGNLGKDPELKEFKAGCVCNFSLATSEKWKDKATGEQKERTQWHAIAIFEENLARIAEKWLKKGSKVYVEGQLETRKWEGQDGATRYATEVVLRPFTSKMIMLSGREDAPAQEAQGRTGNGTRRRVDAPAEAPKKWAPDLDDEIPF